MYEIFKRKEKSQSILEDKRGLTSVEYVIILALIAIAAITAWSRFGVALTGRVSNYTNSISTIDSQAGGGQ